MEKYITGPSCVNRRAPTSKRNTAQLTESKQRIMRELVDGGEPGLKPQIGQVEFDSRLGHFASDVSFIGQQACLQDGQAGRPRLTKQGPAFSSWLRFCSAPLLAPLNSALPKPGPRALNNTFLSFLREKGEGPERRSALCRRVQLPIFDVTVILILHGFWAKQTIKEKRASYLCESAGRRSSGDGSAALVAKMRKTAGDAQAAGISSFHCYYIDGGSNSPYGKQQLHPSLRQRKQPYASVFASASYCAEHKTALSSLHETQSFLTPLLLICSK
ncbi:hypothetical protein T03_9842 [Trichinella britovi]|uniref:Uncharacterized protein n=2 Tax=Trichinella TaxID=6333 RepID=A0A0V1CTF1_TRIBR|nr:hypothetical protein T05_2846 [Trichinella murrelli]KRX71368.1 hypothetical protein T06_9586 [Trichinella sp. T6]KRY52555.1 hypothetical protein T03_9842 [Trichinella britovi]